MKQVIESSNFAKFFKERVTRYDALVPAAFPRRYRDMTNEELANFKKETAELYSNMLDRNEYYERRLLAPLESDSDSDDAPEYIEDPIDMFEYQDPVSDLDDVDPEELMFFEAKNGILLNEDDAEKKLENKKKEEKYACTCSECLKMKK